MGEDPMHMSGRRFKHSIYATEPDIPAPFSFVQQVSSALSAALHTACAGPWVSGTGSGGPRFLSPAAYSAAPVTGPLETGGHQYHPHYHLHVSPGAPGVRGHQAGKHLVHG